MKYIYSLGFLFYIEGRKNWFIKGMWIPPPCYKLKSVYTLFRRALMQTDVLKPHKHFCFTIIQSSSLQGVFFYWLNTVLKILKDWKNEEKLQESSECNIQCFEFSTEACFCFYQLIVKRKSDLCIRIWRRGKTTTSNLKGQLFSTLTISKLL